MDNPVKQEQQPESVGFWVAVLFWFKFGFISFGGPVGQIAMMHRELVEKKGWISDKRFLHALNYCMVLPGPEAHQLAIYIGWMMHRTLGGIISGTLFMLPSLFMLIALSWVYIVFGDTLLVTGLFYGVKPAVTIIILHAAFRLGSRTLKNELLLSIAIIAFIAIFSLNLPFPLIIAVAALIGFFGGHFYPEKFNIGSQTADSKQTEIVTKIDDQSPTPDHAQFRWMTLIKLILVGSLLWAAPMGLLVLIFGWNHSFTQMGWFFTKAAFLTFGGAYAVLPYVYQGAVIHYAWVTPNQMIDGLGLGETTPGPLIMVVAFVGFIGAYTKALLGPEHLFIAGFLAASLVTWFTFLPSYLFIFAGGPLIESTREDLKFTAPLSAITAAVVGVIINLALFFVYHVFWPQGFSAQFELGAVIIALTAVVPARV